VVELVVHALELEAELHQSVVGRVALEAAHQAEVLQVRVPDVGRVVHDERHRLLADGALERLLSPALGRAPTANAT